MDDFIATEIGQVGTQFDGLSHIGVGGDEQMFYNGVPAGEVFGGSGTRKLGIEHIKPFFTRGITPAAGFTSSVRRFSPATAISACMLVG